MPPFDRRDFLSASLAGLAGLQAGALYGAGAEKKPAKPAATSPAAPKPWVAVPPASPDETLFLTWQRDPTTTVTVQWIGPGSGPAPKLEIAPYQAAVVEAAGVAFTAVNGSVAWQAFAVEKRPYHPMSDLRVFRAEATGLKPGIEYQLRVAGVAKPYRFRTMPAKATDTFQFVSGGDCGANDHVIANNQLAARQNPMFALIGGDIAYDNGHDVKANLAFLRNYRGHMVDDAGRLIPMVTCIGNHEVKNGYNAKRTDEPLFFALHDGLYADRTFATLDFGDYLSLVLLDTGHVAPIRGEQTAWLDKALTERADRPHLIVANHVPSYPSYRMAAASGDKTGTGEHQRTDWVPLFEKHAVDLVLEHHDHTFKRTHLLKDGRIASDGILYLGDGSWGKLRAPAKAEVRPYLAKTDSAYHLTVHRLQGEQRFHLAMTEGGGVVDICTTTKKARRKMAKS